MGVIDRHPIDVGDQAEVEQHHPAGRLAQHVRRLEIAVQLAGQVQRVQPVAQLAEPVLEPLEIDRGVDDLGPAARLAPGAGGVIVVGEIEQRLIAVDRGPDPVDE